ncbi:MAG TPA: DNA adenine methylase [Phycisphaerae bacterium]|nr:DNA adenine methylase [Phycisphaerae bacterium]HOI56010.1 DNA adenine methylase [Phycisphaerae bacterium]
MSKAAPTTDTPQITALAPWFGAKRTLAHEIVREFGPHHTYWGLCVGSFAIEMVKPPCSMETVVDLHGDIVNLANVIRDSRLGAMLYRRLRRTMMHETLFAEADAIIRAGERDGTARRLADGLGTDDERLERAYLYFLVSWMGRNGTAGTPASHKGTFCARFTNRGGHAGRRFSGAVDSIPAWRRRLRNLTILRRDIFEIAERIADEDRSVIYCDPPYIAKGASYLHDFTEADHRRLAELLGRFRRTRVVVSYYDHPLLTELYPEWTMRRLKATKAMVHAGRRGNTGRVDAPEVLLINGASLVERTGLLEGLA